MLEVAFDGVDGGCADGDDAFLVALAADADDADGWDPVCEEHVGGFAGAQAAGVHEFEHGAIAHPEFGGRAEGAGL